MHPPAARNVTVVVNITANTGGAGNGLVSLVQGGPVSATKVTSLQYWPSDQIRVTFGFGSQIAWAAFMAHDDDVRLMVCAVGMHVFNVGIRVSGALITRHNFLFGFCRPRLTRSPEPGDTRIHNNINQNKKQQPKTVPKDHMLYPSSLK
jgi:hypothetical protein